ncbi:deoxyribodipyrimidine photo-lyase [Halarsenatibacter silvermanii]|uniref:Deoxyribodipyrimidine photo-lyase n=1 Tax=Halarsenatibacter silvermanii TaxID=321763 RepID=A0A1G9NWK2_9FIRM|nr:deoxyribodipyrimidine photo-lyase [Halarsenatibacter silvermanii]SDL90355.1 deoxyribodipyrimidine photo-lyase [Halarsenatibacter silvermanii]
MTNSHDLEEHLLKGGFDGEDIEILKETDINSEGEYVLYWMQSTQRQKDNKALSAASLLADNLNLPLVVCFVFMPQFPGGNYRHFAFMYDGVKECSEELQDSGFGMKIKVSSPVTELKNESEKAAALVCDSGYIKPARSWRKLLAEEIEIPLLRISTNLIVPVTAASNKEEYAAYTLRKKLEDKIDEYLKIWDFKSDIPDGSKYTSIPEKFSRKYEFLNDLDLNNSVSEAKNFSGGYSAARERLTEFLNNRIEHYEKNRSDPDLKCESDLSPYLHFGHISPREIAIAVKEHSSKKDIVIENFWDELTVRRELSFNFVYYNQNYDCFPEFLPEWARETLAEHKDDERQFNYSRHEFETASTHDKYWNAAQLELIHRGKIQNYMRMYWGKKILEWTETPKKAFDLSLYLNNKYALDGRDPNSYSGIGWCFGKHDRAWQERKIFGKTRYMNRNGLERKFSLDKYLERIKEISRKDELPGD